MAAIHRAEPPGPEDLAYRQVRSILDMVLERWIDHAAAALAKLSSIPRNRRPDWYERLVGHWKGVRSGLAWVKHNVAQEPHPLRAPEVPPPGSRSKARGRRSAEWRGGGRRRSSSS